MSFAGIMRMAGADLLAGVASRIDTATHMRETLSAGWEIGVPTPTYQLIRSACAQISSPVGVVTDPIAT